MYMYMYLCLSLGPAGQLGVTLLIIGRLHQGQLLGVTDVQLLANLGHGEEGHDGKVDSHMVAVLVWELHGEVSVDRGELQLGVGHDPVGVEGLARFVEPDVCVWPPQGIVRPVRVTCNSSSSGDRETGITANGETQIWQV